MIGQIKLQNRINQMIENNTFPRFSIFVGPRGSGKKTLAHWIYQKFGTGLFINIGVSVDSVRQCISESYTIRGSQAIYLFADADNMSNAAKNALLKVTEEPPNNAYFIMTLEDENNTLETIRSRATVFHIDRYTPVEIMKYVTDKYGSINTDDVDILADICETPGEADILIECGVRDFYDYVQLVADNITEVELANAFKIPSKVALKDEADGYDLKLFWNAFSYEMMERAKDIYFNDKANGAVPYLSSYNATRRAIQALNTKGINRNMLMDTWILTIRRIHGVM